MNYYLISLFLFLVSFNSFAINHTLPCISYHQTTNYTCGPASIMSFMQYNGLLNTTDLNPNTERYIAKEMGAQESGGTSASQMSSWLKEKGFKVESGSYITSDIIIDYLQKGIPLFVSVDHHWLLTKGYNEEDIIFSDPACSTRIIPKKIIDSAWSFSHMQGNERFKNDYSYILAYK